MSQLRTRRARPLRGLFVISALVACEPVAPPGFPPFSEVRECQEERRFVEGNLREEIPALGFSVQQVLDLVVGVHSERMSWTELEYPYNPGVGSAEISVEIELSGVAQWVDASPPLSREPQEAGVSSDCLGWLEVPIRVRVHTNDGALDESVEAVVVAFDEDAASVSMALEGVELAGSFDAAAPVPDGFILESEPAVGLELRFSSGGVTGEVSASSTFERLEDGAQVTRATPDVATFPVEAYCGREGLRTSPGEPFRGLSIRRAVERMNRAFPVTLSDSEVTLSVEFSKETESACLQLTPHGDEQARLRFEATVAFESSDGKLLGRSPVEMSAIALRDGSVFTVSNASLVNQGVGEASQFATEFGIHEPLDFGAYNGSAFEFEAHASSAGSEGWVRAHGLKIPDCIGNPPLQDPNASSLAPCRGVESVLLWGVEWSGD